MSLMKLETLNAQARDLVGSLPLPLGEDRGEGAQRMAEILEA